MKIKIKKFGVKIVVGTLIGLIFMSAIASKQGYVAEAGPTMTCAPGFTGDSCEQPTKPGSGAGAAKPAATPAPTPITCPAPFTPSADGFSCEAPVGGDGKLTGGADAVCPEGFNTASLGDKLVCTKAVKSMANSEDLIKRMNALIWIQGALNRLIWPVLVLIGGLMDNDLLFGNGMEERLREIWIPIRNLVNILFVILLVGIALYNVLGIGDNESSSLKSVLPKIIIGIIAINFSFLAIKVFLDAVNVLTTSVFALPGQVSEGLALLNEDGKDKETIKRLCQSLSGMSSQDFKSMTDEQMTAKDETQIYMDAFNKVKNKYPNILSFPSIVAGDTIETIQGKINSISALNPSLSIKTEFNKDVQASKSGMICVGSELSSQGRIFLKRFNSSNASFAMALLLGKIVYYQDLKLGDFSDIEKVAFNALFSMIFYLVYAASFVALLIVLLARLVIMWISIALSPILILALASSTVKEKLGGFSKLTEQFTKMAIAPLIIAITMAIGWIMLRALQSVNMFDSQSTLKINMANGIPVVGLSTIQDLVVACGTIAIVWLGVFGAAEGTIAEKLTGTIKDGLQTAGKWVGALPFRHIPFVPISIPGEKGGEPVHYTGAEVTQALHDVFREDSRSQDKLSKALKIGSDGEDDIKDVKTREELYKHFDKKDASEMTSDKYVSELKRWKEDSATRGEFEKLDGNLRKSIDKLIKAKKDKDEDAVDEAVGEIKGHNDVRYTSQRGAGETPSTPAPAEGEYKPVDGDGEIGGRKIKDIPSPDAGTKEHGIQEYNRKGSELSGDVDKLMKSKGDGKNLTSPETQKLITALQGLRLLGIAPIERELRKQIGTKKVDYLVKALGNGDATTGKAQLDTHLGNPPAAQGGQPPAGPAVPPSTGGTPPPSGP
ncbi:MAG: hypothetical protein AAB540_02075 [Patescibacteria group bacterium]